MSNSIRQQPRDARGSRWASRARGFLWTGLAAVLFSAVFLGRGSEAQTRTVVGEDPQESTIAATPEQARQLGGTSCRNSYDEACGPFRYERQPDKNQPLKVDVRVSPSRPKAGQEVTFTVVANDPDATIDRECVGGHYGDGLSDPKSCSSAICFAQHGTWTPPPKRSDRLQMTFRHVYSAAGTYEAAFPFLSSGECGNPFDSRSDGLVNVTVR
jgi:hypothetical protein